MHSKPLIPILYTVTVYTITALGQVHVCGNICNTAKKSETATLSQLRTPQNMWWLDRRFTLIESGSLMEIMKSESVLRDINIQDYNQEIYIAMKQEDMLK